MEMFVAALAWGAVLGYIALASKQTMQMTWLVLLGLMLAGILLIFSPVPY